MLNTTVFKPISEGDRYI